MIEVSLAFSWHKMHFLKHAGVTLLVEPAIYLLGFREGGEQWLALAHHPGSEVNVRVPVRPYRHMHIRR
jgi:hypothetical protein